MNNTSQAKKEQSYPRYPEPLSSEDVYKKWMEETELNPENISKRKAPPGMPGNKQDKAYAEVRTGRGLDVPGSELDDAGEKADSED